MRVIPLPSMAALVLLLASAPAQAQGWLDWAGNQYLHPEGSPGVAWPAAWTGGANYYGFVQAYNGITSSPGAQTQAQGGYGPCVGSPTDMSGWSTWQMGTFNAQVGNNDEHRFVFNLPGTPAGESLCVGMRVQMIGAPAGEWRYVFQHAVTVTCADADADGVCNAVDTCPGGADGADADSDGVCDALDACPGDDGADGDSDGVCDGLDVCPGQDDAEDADGDGLPDGCDDCPLGDAALDYHELVYVFSDGVGLPSVVEVGATVDFYAQAFNASTPAAGAQSSALFGWGACDAGQVGWTWDVATYNGQRGPGGNNDEHAYSLVIAPEMAGELCFAFDLQASGAGVCYDRTEEYRLQACLDSDDDGVCDDEDVCPGSPDDVDGDGDGLPDGCDDCPLGDAALDYHELVYVFSDGVAFPAEVELGSIVDFYAQAFNASTPAAGAQTVAWLGWGACDVGQADWTWDLATYNGQRGPSGNNDEHRYSLELTPDFAGEVCFAFDLQAVGAGVCTDRTVEYRLQTCTDSDGDGVCDDADACPGAPDGVDGDGDGIPDACDDCPLGDYGLDIARLQWVEGPDGGYPASLEVGQQVVAYVFGENEGTDVLGPQTNARFGWGSCGVDRADWTWDVPTFNDLSIFIQDEHFYVLDLTEDMAFQTVCFGFEIQAQGAGDCWAETEDYALEVTCDDGDGDGVCDLSDVCPGFDDAVDSNANGTPDGCERPVLRIEGQFAATHYVYLEVTDADPGSQVFFMRGLEVGDGPCPSTLGGLCLDITHPVLLRVATADETGRARALVRMPRTLPVGEPWVIQAGYRLPSGEVALTDPLAGVTVAE